MFYRTNSALLIRGDRVEAGSEIELTADEAAGFDPADITAVDSIPEPEPEAKLSDTPIEEMTAAQLKDYAKELGLSASGSKADLEERIRLHLAGAEGTEEEIGSEEGQGAEGTEEELPDDNQ